ncbi:hypothetical protein HY772_05930 [Candidatus Woesearchaeota archaeon]|nr:hypothetical protein [Candidatus Woesearchaeota archaeon]
MGAIDNLREKLSRDLFLRIKHGLDVERPLSVAIEMRPYGFFAVAAWLESRGYRNWILDGNSIFYCLSVEEIRALAELPEVKAILLSGEVI